MKSKKGFTLMEVIAVIGVIGILATISVVAISVIKAKSRDVDRLNDVKSIHTALRRYMQEAGRYPAVLTPGLPLVGPEGTTFMGKVPNNPRPMDDGNCFGADYKYTAYENGRDFTLEYCLGVTNLEGQCQGVQYAIPSTIAAPANCNGECCYGDYICINGSCCQKNCGQESGDRDGCGGTCDEV